MSKLIWDATGERRYETGVSHGILFVRKSDGTYDNGVVWNGLTTVTETPAGAEAVDLWADNIKYATFRSAETFGGTIEAYTYPDEFAECDGQVAITSGVYLGQQARKTFGFCYRTDVGTDADADLNEATGYKIHIVWGASASPSERSFETINDSPDAITFSWEFTTTPVPVTDRKPTSLMVIDTSKLTATADAAKLAKLEDRLYGTDGASGAAGTDSTLPSPDDIVTLFTTGDWPAA